MSRIETAASSITEFQEHTKFCTCGALLTTKLEMEDGHDKKTGELKTYFVVSCTASFWKKFWGEHDWYIVHILPSPVKHPPKNWGTPFPMEGKRLPKLKKKTVLTGSGG